MLTRASQCFSRPYKEVCISKTSTSSCLDFLVLPSRHHCPLSQLLRPSCHRIHLAAGTTGSPPVAEVDAASLPHVSHGVKDSILLPKLLHSCPGCGALSQGLGIQEEAGYYNPSRKPVKSFLAEGNTRPEALERVDDGLRLADGSIPHALHLDKDAVGKSTSQYSIIENGQRQTEDEIQLPLCNRCHCLLHHNTGQSIAHPSLHSIHQTIDESPHGHNHVYHVLDAADFPLSLIPQLQRRLDLTPQRSQNRRAKTRVFRRGRQADMSFIVTRSDLLAPQKAQVDKLMPYLVQVLRAALGSVGQGVRLGNVHCVSAKRGWWTSQIKDEIRERGGGVWLVGKVNVGKSNLFECIFPKSGAENCSRIPPTAIRTPNLPSHGPHGKSARHPGPHTAGKSQFFDHQRAMGDVLLPPPQPEKRFPTMPTVSHLPGTTASPIRIPFGGGKGEVIDLPGLARGSLEEYVLSQHRSDLVMRQRIKPVQYVIKPGQSLLISGLVRITPSTPGITLLAYPFVPLTAHVTSTEKAIAINTQTHSSGVPTIAKPGIGQKMALAGSFQLQWDVTKQRAGPLTSSSAAGLSVNALPFVVLAVDILIEGCGWVELTAQVRLKNMDYTGGGSKFPMVDIWSPNGDYIAQRQPMNGWLLGKTKVSPAGRSRPRRSMKGVKKNQKLANRR